MSKASSVVLNLKLEDDNETLVDITKYVDDISQRTETIEEEEVTPYGTEFRKYDSAGVKGIEQMTFSGFYSDDPDHPVQLLADSRGTFREMEITWISGDTEVYDCLIINEGKVPQQRQLTRYSFVVRPQHQAAS